MTSIHARIPADMRQLVDEARRRGEVPEEIGSSRTNQPSSLPLGRRRMAHELRLTAFPQPRIPTSNDDESTESDEENDEHDPHKENDPSQSPTPVIQSPLSPRNRVLGKRPLSELPVPTSTDCDDGMTASEKNIAVNQGNSENTAESDEPARKAAKLTRTHPITGGSDRFGGSSFSNRSAVWVDSPVSWADDKENISVTSTKKSTPSIMQPPARPQLAVQKTSSSSGNSTSSVKSKANKPRTGIRRI